MRPCVSISNQYDAAVADADAIDVQRLGDDHGVDSIRRQSLVFRQPGDTGEAAALFVDRPADFDRPLEGDAGAANRLCREHGRGDPRFHVARAAPVDAAVANHPAKRIDRPAGAGRDDVEMAVEVHVRPLGPPSPRADDVDPRMACGVFGPAFRGVILDAEVEVGETRANVLRTLGVELAGRIDGGNANQLRGKRRQFVGGVIDSGKESIESAGRRQHRNAFNRILGGSSNQGSGIRDQGSGTRNVVPEADCLSDRRNHRDALPPRRRRTHRWHLRLHGAAARGAAEAEGVVVPARALREDRGAQTRSDPRILGPAGGDYQRARAPRAAGVHLQSAQRRRDSADGPRARRDHRRLGQGGGPRPAAG